MHSTEAWRETCSLDLDPRDCGRITTTGVGTVVVRTSKEHGESIKKGHLKSTHFTRENSNNVKDLDELEPSLRGWAFYDLTKKRRMCTYYRHPKLTKGFNCVSLKKANKLVADAILRKQKCASAFA